MAIKNRISRFHDEKGNRVDLTGALYAPLAFASAVGRVAFGYRPPRPMLSYRATRVIDDLLKNDWRCVEFGSGLSTGWFARRCDFLLSVEDNSDWHALVQARIRSAGINHVQYELRERGDYADLSAFADASFDFVLIDGWDRHGCVLSAVSKVRAGGWIYLDNSDKDMTIPNGDLRRAEAALLAAVEDRGGTVRYFVDFSPTNFFVEQGLLVQL